MTDYVTGKKTLTLAKDYGSYRDDSNGMEHDESTTELYRIQDPLHCYDVSCPLSAETEVLYAIELGRSRDWIERLKSMDRYAGNEVDAWRVRMESRTVVKCTEATFEVTSELCVFEMKSDGARNVMLKRNWSHSIPREFI
jgi:hypothetical protein